MPSEKRARQRAAREQKVAEIERAQRSRRVVRRSITGVLVVGVIVLIVFLLAGNNSPAKPAAVTTTSSSTPATTANSGSTTSSSPTASSSPTTSSGPTTTTVNPCTVAPTPTTLGTVPTTIPSAPPTTAPICKTAVAPVCPPTTAAGAAKREINFTKAPPICINENDIYEATVLTDLGTFVITMHPKESPAAVNNFVFLARYHFFDGIIFHRVIPGFVVQGGDPTGTGEGGPGYSWTGNVPPKGCTAKKDCYETGSIAMANSSGPSTNGSQFFLVLPGGASTLNSEPNYTNFGQVTSGQPIVNRIGSYGTSAGTPSKALYMIKVTITQIPG